MMGSVAMLPSLEKRVRALHRKLLYIVSVLLILCFASCGFSTDGKGALTEEADKEINGLKVNTGLVNANGTKLYYERAGKGDAVILVHDEGLNMALWDAQFYEFAKSFDTIRYDLRAHGKSERVTEAPYSQSEDLLMLMEGLGLSKASLVGLGKGAGIVLDFAAAYPERTSRVAAVSGGFSTSDAITAVERAEIREKAYAENEELADQFAKMTPEKQQETIVDIRTGRKEELLSKKAPGSEMLDTLIGHMTDQWDAYGRVHKNREELSEPPAFERFQKGEAEASVMVIIGEYTHEADKEAMNEAAGFIPGVTKVSFSESGHFPNLEETEKFNKVVMEFLRSKF